MPSYTISLLLAEISHFLSQPFQFWLVCSAIAVGRAVTRPPPTYHLDVLTGQTPASREGMAALMRNYCAKLFTCTCGTSGRVSDILPEAQRGGMAPPTM